MLSRVLRSGGDVVELVDHGDNQAAAVAAQQLAQVALGVGHLDVAEADRLPGCRRAGPPARCGPPASARWGSRRAGPR